MKITNLLKSPCWLYAIIGAGISVLDGAYVVNQHGFQQALATAKLSQTTQMSEYFLLLMTYGIISGLVAYTIVCLACEAIDRFKKIKPINGLAGI